MKPSELFEALHALIAERVPLHIWGACGVGKSQIVAQVTTTLNPSRQRLRSNRKIGRAESVAPDQVVSIVGQSQ